MFWNQEAKKLAQEARDLAQASVDMQIRQWLVGQRVVLNHRGDDGFGLRPFLDVWVRTDDRFGNRGYLIKFKYTIASPAAFEGLHATCGANISTWDGDGWFVKGQLGEPIEFVESGSRKNIRHFQAAS